MGHPMYPNHPLATLSENILGVCLKVFQKLVRSVIVRFIFVFFFAYFGVLFKVPAQTVRFLMLFYMKVTTRRSDAVSTKLQQQLTDISSIFFPYQIQILCSYI